MHDNITPEFWHKQTVNAMRTFEHLLHEHYILVSNVRIVDDAGCYAHAYITIAEVEDSSPEFSTTIHEAATKAMSEYCEQYNMSWLIGGRVPGELTIELREKESVCWPWFKEDDCDGCTGRNTCKQRAEWNTPHHIFPPED